MLTDVKKDLVPLISASSTKEAAIAYKNSLMKKVFVHESMKKFVDRVDLYFVSECGKTPILLEGCNAVYWGGVVCPKAYP